MVKKINLINNILCTKVFFFCGLALSLFFSILVFSVNKPRTILFYEKDGIILLSITISIFLILGLITDLFIFLIKKKSQKVSEQIAHLMNAIVIVLTLLISILMIVMIFTGWKTTF